MALATPSNTWPRLAAALIMGVLLFQVLVVILNGYLAAIGVPKSYFAWFGRPRLELALCVLQFALAAPVFLLLAAGVLATCRMFRTRTKLFLASLLVGMLLCFSYWTMGSLVIAPDQLPPGVEPYPLAVRVKQLFYVSWWALPTALAPWLGFAFASWLLLRRSREA